MTDSAPWWSTYFDEDYVRLYRPFLPAESTLEDAAGVVGMLGLPDGARVLDLACGWGRHSVALSRLGLKVTGLDRSPVLLDLARRSAIEVEESVEWVRGDMRHLPFRAAFDAVVSLFSSLGYFETEEEDAAVLAEVREALRPDGLFLMEIMHRDHIVREYVERDWWEGPGGAHVWVEREFDAVAGVSREWLRWRRGRITGEKHHTIRVRTATEWVRLLEGAGLRVVECYGGWDLSPFDRHSERLVVVAHRDGPP